MELWIVSPLYPGKLKVCLEVVRNMSWNSCVQINANYLSFYTYIYCWNARQRALKIFQQMTNKKQKMFSSLLWEKVEFCVSPKWSPPESCRLVHWKLSFPIGSMTLNKSICAVAIKAYHLPIFQDIMRFN